MLSRRLFDLRQAMANIPGQQSDRHAEAADPRTPHERLRELAQDPALAPIVAANPAVGAALLSELTIQGENAPLIAALAGIRIAHMDPHKLFDHTDETLAAVAANANTPAEALIRLAGVFPEQLCSNPALPLLLLEYPNLPAEMPPRTIRGLLRYPNVPHDFLEWIVAHSSPALADEARMHVNVAGEAGDDWEAQAISALRHLTLSIEIVSRRARK
jgi:hypothetical protein